MAELLLHGAAGQELHVVDQEDIDQFNYWANVTASNSSWYDFNLDGLTDGTDLATIQQNLGTQCTN